MRVTWRDERTGRIHIARSDRLRDDPGPELEGRTHVRVLYDRADSKRGRVDLSCLR